MRRLAHVSSKTAPDNTPAAYNVVHGFPKYFPLSDLGCKIILGGTQGKHF